ncbi:hypothetical protein [Peribacillus sp. R9-11]|uniref:hypothetical protein n=1 Tax=Peribacillus sp. R9-11 TaxID=3073271 RepID=UPI002868806C|nr:hypothetical protein [Peribacillus sp. R9-11]WMX58985.1 hypothetical protein RE409_30330 [Peribacillus sp. R9-11]
MSLEKYCLYCQRRFPQVEYLKPIYSWTNGELEGYFCERHFDQVKAFNMNQKEAYEKYNKTKGEKG